MSFDLSLLPTVSAKRLALRVTPDALRQVRAGHPWVYDRSITSVSHDAPAGDLAVVFDGGRKFAAIGLWDPRSPIRVKILHTGRPRAIDSDFWRDRLSAAISLRQPLLDDADTTAVRLVHGENDGLPGLIIDRYSEVVVIKLYSEAWIPHLKSIITQIGGLVEPESVVLRLSRNITANMPFGLSEGSTLMGRPPDEPVMFLENGLRFEAQTITGQKTGHFLDQRDNRRMIRDLARGASVLDVFSCTGGFSVHAAAGGARSVHCIDIADSAIEASRRNMAHNHSNPLVRACEHLWTVGDAFETMHRLIDRGAQFDVVVVDPPSFAQRQDNVASALRAYTRLTTLALDLTSNGGLLMQASCSSRVTAEAFHGVVSDTAAARGIRLEEIARTAHVIDHPIGFSQGAYLKAVFATVHKGRPDIV